MALFVRDLNDTEYLQLQRMAQSDDAIQSRWGRIVLLSSGGMGVPTIANTLEISAATVRSRIKEFNERGMDALVRGTSPGRPETLPPSLGDQFAELMRERQPRDFGWANTGWTLDLLVKAATVEGWVENISREGVRLALRKSKHSYRRLKGWARSRPSEPAPTSESS